MSESLASSSLDPYQGESLADGGSETAIHPSSGPARAEVGPPRLSPYPEHSAQGNLSKARLLVQRLSQEPQLPPTDPLAGSPGPISLETTQERMVYDQMAREAYATQENMIVEEDFSVANAIYAAPLKIFTGTILTARVAEDTVLAAMAASTNNIQLALTRDEDSFREFIRLEAHGIEVDQEELHWRDLTASLSSLNAVWARITGMDEGLFGHPAWIQASAEVADLKAQVAAKDKEIGELKDSFINSIRHLQSYGSEALQGFQTTTMRTLEDVQRSVNNIKSTMRAVGTRVDSIASTPHYAQATASSGTKQSEKSVRFEAGPMGEATSGKKEVEGKQEKTSKKRPAPSDNASRVPSPAPNKRARNEIIDLTTVEDWEALGEAAAVGKLAPGVSVADALNIAIGLRPGAKASGLGTKTTSKVVSDKKDMKPLAHAGLVHDGQGGRMTARMTATPWNAGGAQVDGSGAKSARPIKHVPQPAGAASSKALVVRFSRPLIMSERRLADDIRNGVTTILGHIGSANYVSTTRWEPKGSDVQIIFNERPTTDELGAISVERGVFVPAELREGGMNPVGITVDHARTITQIAVRAAPVFKVVSTRTAYNMTELYHELVEKNKWLAEHILPPHNSPCMRFVSASGGSRFLLFTIFDTKSGSTAVSIAKRTVKVFGKTCKLQLWEEPDRNPLCTRCWRWGHIVPTCKATKECCAKCGDPHLTELHDELNTCCMARRAVLGVKEAACPQSHAKCPNCGKSEHQANDPRCVWFKNRKRPAWYNNHQLAIPAMTAIKKADGQRSAEKRKGLSEKAKGKRREREISEVAEASESGRDGEADFDDEGETEGSAQGPIVVD